MISLVAAVTIGWLVITGVGTAIYFWPKSFNGEV